MENGKKYPHLRDEAARLRTLCAEALAREYGGQIPDAAAARLEKELAAYDALGLSGVLLLLHGAAARLRLQRYEIVPCGALGASLVVWLCGLSPYDPMQTALPLYPEFCFEGREPSLEFRVPTGKAEAFYALLRESEGIGDLEQPSPNRPSRILIPEDNAQKAPLRAYCKVLIAENPLLRLLSRLAAQTHADPEDIRLDDEEVLKLFQAVNHPAGLEVMDWPPSAIGLIGNEEDAFELYANGHTEVTSFADTVRIDALLRSTGAWRGNQDDLVYGSCRIVPFSELIGSREDVYEYCRDALGFGEEEAFYVASCVYRGTIPPLYKTKLPERFGKFDYLWTRAHSYGFLLTAWRCAWYRLHKPEAFYRAYFELVADPLVAAAAEAGKSVLDALKPYVLRRDDPLLHEKAAFDVDLAVAEEMYRRGIDLA